MRFHPLPALFLASAIAPLAHGEGLSQSVLKSADIDPAAFTECFAGKQQTPAGTRDGALDALWTQSTRPDFRGVQFGDSALPGVRHLRVGLKSAVAIGSVLVRGGGKLSVLKADAVYPGDVERESDWVAAERIEGGALSAEEVGRDGVAIWTLPVGTTTRALRFTHTAEAADPKYAGWLGGAVVLSERWTNVAPQGIAAASARDEAASKTINGVDEQWKAWDNGKEGAATAASPEHAEWLLLSWPRAVSLNGIATLWTGFGAAEVQVYTGPAGKHPREASEADWKTLKRVENLENGYPLALAPAFIEFGQTVQTRAVRVRMTGPSKEQHGHLKGNTKEGKRVWLGELMALQPLGKDALKTALMPKTDESHPPIAVRFNLPEAGFVTLVIEDAKGTRVRNLVSETRFEKGPNVAWWDGTDDLGRDIDAARHGLYHIPEQPVAPGTYKVRGLFHKGLDLRFEFSIYNSGNPAWETADTTGGWLTNHTPPQAVLFVPADKTPSGKPLVYIGSAVSEGGAGLAWVDLDGKKQGGRGWIGGNWTAAPTLTRDAGKNAVPEVIAYVGATWTSSSKNEDKTHGELRITALTLKGDKPVLKEPFTAPPRTEAAGDNDWIAQLGGIAAHDGRIVASMNKLGALWFVDARTGQKIGEAAVEAPEGVAFDAQGRLLVLSGKRLLRFSLGAAPLPLPAPEVLAQLEAPMGITLDAAGRIYISDRGNSQQVKVFEANGKFLRAIGKAGAPAAGIYDERHMNNPHGLAIDEKGRLWVAENDFQPKRVSVWTAEGEFLRASYGPGRYGGGGTLDPKDASRFYYDGIEFALNWKTGENRPKAVYHRSGTDDLNSQFRAGAPETPLYFNGRQYLTNCFNSNPTGGHPLATLWLLNEKSVAVPVASFGRANDWALLKEPQFKACWPAGVDLAAERNQNSALFVWSDLNGDGRVQPEEVSMKKGSAGGVTVSPELAFLEARSDEQALRLVPRRFTETGVPVYDLATAEVLFNGAQSPTSSGGDQALVSPDGWTVLTIAPKPFAREALGGGKNGDAQWSYPSLWPGLHASHEAPTADRPGELLGTTRLLGDFVTAPKPSDAGALFAVNGNMGNAYLFTADGLFVSQFFQDVRQGRPWSMPSAERGMRLNDVSLHDENFFPTMAQTADGKVFLCDGARTSLVRVDGLESIRRIGASELKVSGDDLKNAAAWRLQAEAQRQAARGTGSLTVALKKMAPVVDGKLDDWAGADWAVIDRRGTAANFNSDSKPYDITAAVTIAGDRLYAAFRTQDAELLRNSGETPNAPFKTGGALDLMLGTNAAADPKRSKPVAGDERLLVTQVKGKTLALLYRAVVPGTAAPVPFSSPWRTITLDRVEDVSASVELASTVERDEKGRARAAFYEISVPLKALGLGIPSETQTLKGDLGILRGNGFQTLQRVYWNNKATAITSDVPSEAELAPALWGKWLFKTTP